jgi:hypothetical protein
MKDLIKLKGESKMIKAISIMTLFMLLFSFESSATNDRDECTIQMTSDMKSWIKKSLSFSDENITDYTMEQDFQALAKLRDSFAEIDFDECTGNWVPYAAILKDQIDTYFAAQEKIVEYYEEWNELDEAGREQLLVDKPNCYRELNILKGGVHGDIFLSSIDLAQALKIGTRYSDGPY